MNRRKFLTGKFNNKPAILRPPWALSEALFTDRCTRCNGCIEACETGILLKGAGGYPEVNFALGECTFCEACVAHCSSQALSLQISPPWMLTASVSEACLAYQSVVCMSCRDHCPEQAIRLQPRVANAPLPIIDAQKCSGCGACFAPCPTGAIQLLPRVNP